MSTEPEYVSREICNERTHQFCLWQQDTEALLREHSKLIVDLNKRDAANAIRIENITKSLDRLTTALWGAIAVFVGYIIKLVIESF